MYQGVGSARDIFRGSGFILQMDHDIILLFSKCKTLVVGYFSIYSVVKDLFHTKTLIFVIFCSFNNHSPMV